MREKAVVILDALLSGSVVEKDDKKYVIIEGDLCQECTKITQGIADEKVFVAVGFGSMTLKEFIDWANSFSSDDVFIVSSNSALNKMKH